MTCSLLSDLQIFEVILKMCIVALETVSLAAENVNDDQEKAEEELRLTTKRVREFQREAVKLYFCQEGIIRFPVHLIAPMSVDESSLRSLIGLFPQSDMVVFPRAEYIVKELFQLRNRIADGPFLSRLEKVGTMMDFNCSSIHLGQYCLLS